MASPIDERRTEVQQLVKRFEDRLRLARASELASLGRLLEAEVLLCPGRHLPMSADELDMLARIYVKQGQFEQARRRWEDAVKTGDLTAEYEECIKVLDDWLDYRKRLMKWRLRAALFISVVLLASSLLSWFYFSPLK